ncbi:MAG TPA: RNA-binding S4 domain-containing protein [Coleofasciculaceae cyanobacterium]
MTTPDNSDNPSQTASQNTPQDPSADTSQTSSIKLDQYLKWAGAVQTGGEAKLLIQSGEVKVNGKLETRRGRKLVEGDRISVMGDRFIVKLSELGSR